MFSCYWTIISSLLTVWLCVSMMRWWWMRNMYICSKDDTNQERWLYRNNCAVYHIFSIQTEKDRWNHVRHWRIQKENDKNYYERNKVVCQVTHIEIKYQLYVVCCILYDIIIIFYNKYYLITGVSESIAYNVNYRMFERIL